MSTRPPESWNGAALAPQIRAQSVFALAPVVAPDRRRSRPLRPVCGDLTKALARRVRSPDPVVRLGRRHRADKYASSSTRAVEGRARVPVVDCSGARHPRAVGQLLALSQNEASATAEGRRDWFLAFQEKRVVLLATTPIEERLTR